MIVNGEPGNANFSLESAIKDMQLMVSEIDAIGMNEQVIAAALKSYKKAEQAGFTGLDCSLVAALNNR